MNAKMPHPPTHQPLLIKGLMQTVQDNDTLEPRFMHTIDVHQKDRFGNTALYWAIYHHHMHNAKLLLYYGCSLTLTTEGKTAGFCAVDANNLDFFMLLLENGLDIFMEYQGESLVDYTQRLGTKEIKTYLSKMCAL